ncbi:MAG: serine hydrolase, partial [Clostridia bacterium]|nr:serine hydrolase [Clostridia bacterium]
GKFLVTDPLYEYIPEFKDMYVRDENGNVKKVEKDIKILNLFNMTAGFTYDVEAPWVEKAKKHTDGKLYTSQAMRFIAEEPLAFEPGERFLYSLCHDVLGAFVEIVSGKKFRDYVKENIFDPLGMNDSAYHLTDEIRSNMAAQYRFVPTGAEEKFNIVEAQKSGDAKDGCFVDVGLNRGSNLQGPEFDAGGSGIISTADDYMKLIAALANMGTGLNGEQILSKNTVELLRTNTLTENQLKTFDWRQLIGYGYGMGVRTMMDRAKAGSLSNVGEFGWGGAAGATVLADPSIRLAAVYLKHTLNPREAYYMPRLRNAIYSCL